MVCLNIDRVLDPCDGEDEKEDPVGSLVLILEGYVVVSNPSADPEQIKDGFDFSWRLEF